MKHQGGHAKLYNKYMLRRIEQIDMSAKGDVNLFLDGVKGVKNHIKRNPEMMYKKYWIKMGVK